jgi:hypothetical protein
MLQPTENLLPRDREGFFSSRTYFGYVTSYYLDGREFTLLDILN